MNEGIEQWKERVLSEYGGRAVLTEDEIAHRLGYEIAAFDLCDNAWLLKDRRLPDHMFKREIGPALGLGRIVASGWKGNEKYIVFA